LLQSKKFIKEYKHREINTTQNILGTIYSVNFLLNALVHMLNLPVTIN